MSADPFTPPEPQTVFFAIRWIGGVTDGKFQTHHGSWVMPALYQTYNKAKSSAERAKRYHPKGTYAIVKIDLATGLHLDPAVYEEDVRLGLS